MKGISIQAAGKLENKFKYNGKEQQHQEFSDGSGLEWYDYGARMQDPQLGRWWTVDNKIEKYYSWSPYVYAINDPIKFIDPDGRDIYIWYPTTDENGLATQKYFQFNGTNGASAPKNLYVQEVIKAYNYDVENGGGDNLKEAASNPNLKIGVTDNGWTGNQYLEGVVYWDPYQALTDDDGLHTSPATGLEHEFDHAVDDAKHHIAHKIRSHQDDNQYDDKEERRVETGSEKKTATKNKEIKPGLRCTNKSGQ